MEPVLSELRLTKRLPLPILFQPPPLRPTVALDWVLQRAFGPPQRRPLPERHRGEASRWCWSLGLAATVARRAPAGLLDAELGASLAEPLKRALLRQAAEGLRLQACTAELCRALAPSGMRVVLLKHAALDALGLVQPPERTAVDVDVLVRDSQLRGLSEVLGAAGYTRDARWRSKIHPLVMVAPSGIPIECHTTVPGIAVDGRGSPVTFESLELADLLGAVASCPGAFRVPRERVVAAHLIAHALVQHRFTPEYPAMRLLLDAASLRLDLREELAAASFGLVRHGVDASEYQALVHLVGCLRRGASVAEILGTAEPGRLLAHVIFSASDPVYREGLLVKRQRQRIAEHGLPSWMFHHASTLFDRKVRSGRSHEPARGLFEPFRSAARLARGVAAALRMGARK